MIFPRYHVLLCTHSSFWVYRSMPFCVSHGGMSIWTESIAVPCIQGETMNTLSVPSNIHLVKDKTLPIVEGKGLECFLGLVSEFCCANQIHAMWFTCNYPVILCFTIYCCIGCIMCTPKTVRRIPDPFPPWWDLTENVTIIHDTPSSSDES